ncbi:ECM29 [Lepeophtheirus salmonis]|uniref:ECM29 n=1 Tax=Lepeophtheirus salmonis TaxID=72036 RepID=A0A7R8H9U9_LEPSM|nr:ECM29 [Lepeophtheirus salmonis]CAF2955416.1 ECM29 [Lepeophtheirus salmonis]
MLILNGICFAIGEIGRCGSLPITFEKKLEVSNRLINLVKSEKMPMKLREKAAISVGQLCVGDSTFPHRQVIIDGLIKTSLNVEEIELHLSVGEALVSSSDESYLANLLDELIQVHTKSTHPKMKQASCLWLLSVVKNSLEFSSVKERLLKIQSAFMGLLGETSDLVQDAAAKGLGIVYESCTEEQKTNMANQLVGTLLEDKNTVIKQVTEDTKLFEKGELARSCI